MPKIIVCDTTTLIVLEKLDSLNLLGLLFDQVLIPRRVFQEWVDGSQKDLLYFRQYKFLKLVKLDPSSRLDSLNKILDEGEAQAITLAVSRKLPLIIDEAKGRKIAKQFEIEVIGFVGIIIALKRKHYVNKKQARSLVDNAIQQGFRLSARLTEQVFEQLK